MFNTFYAAILLKNEEKRRGVTLYTKSSYIWVNTVCISYIGHTAFNYECQN